MAFAIPKKMSLDFLGEGWHDAYINFSLPSLKESINQPTPTEEELNSDPKKYTSQMVAFTEKHFLSGKGWDGSQLVDLQASDIQELPPIVFMKATELLSGNIDPNSNGASNS